MTPGPARDTGATVRDALARFASRVRYDDLPAATVHQAKRCLFDFIGVALAGTEVGVAPSLARMMAREGGRPEALPIGGTQRLPAASAALVSGVNGHTLDMDDGQRQANLHPGVGVIPAALAVGDRVGAGGRALIEAVCVGYEVVLRLGAALSPDHLLRGFHTTATTGYPAAAATAARLLNLSASQTAEAISLAVLQSGGLLEALTSGQMSKPFQVGCASQGGVRAALLAAEGVEGPRCVFEGEKGFFRAFAERGAAMQVVDGLAVPERIMSVYFKRHAACRHVHASLDAVLRMLEQERLDAGAVERIEVETYSIALMLAGQHTGPDSGIAAKFSLPVSLGLLLTFGRADPDVYTDANVARPEVQALADRVATRADDGRDARYPAERSARVTVHTADRTHEREVTIPKGDPENPFSDAELMDKFRPNAAVVLPDRRVERLAELIWELERHDTAALLAAAAPASMG